MMKFDEFKRKRVFYAEDEIVIFASKKAMWFCDCKRDIKLEYPILDAFNILRLPDALYIQNLNNKIYKIDLKTLELSMLPKTKKIGVFDDGMLFYNDKIITYYFNDINIYDRVSSTWKNLKIQDGFINKIVVYKNDQLLIRKTLDDFQIEIDLLNIKNYEITKLKQVKRLDKISYIKNKDIYIEQVRHNEFTLYKGDDLFKSLYNIKSNHENGYDYLRNINIEDDYLYFTSEDSDNSYLYRVDYKKNIEKVVLVYPRNFNLEFALSAGLLFVTIYKDFYQVVTSWTPFTLQDFNDGEWQLINENDQVIRKKIS